MRAGHLEAIAGAKEERAVPTVVRTVLCPILWGGHEAKATGS